MKKLIFGGIFLFGILLMSLSCDKSVTKDHKFEGNKPDQTEKAQWPPSINIDVPFEPIRLARSTTDRLRDGYNCNCNECFGICNRPWNGLDSDNGIFASIGVERLSTDEVNLYILNSLPANFEKEFGIDERVELKDLNGVTKYILEPGEYNAIHEEGFVRCDANGKNYSYFVKIKVNLE